MPSRIHFPSAAASDRGPLAARLRYKDSRRDLAILTVETPAMSAGTPRSYIVKRGEDVTILGSPGLSNGEA